MRLVGKLAPAGIKLFTRLEMTFDYIIVGAGSAGSVVANRLCNANQQVLLVEAGPENKGIFIKMPAACLKNLKSKNRNWAFKGEPEAELNGRKIQHDRGKTLGGSSSINGMVFIRGHALDYDGWRQSGCKGWGYRDVLPYFKKMENYSGGGDSFRGSSGPLKIQRPKADNPLFLNFIEAGKEAGYPLTEDINGFRQEGFGLLDSSIFKGERSSTAVSYLQPIKNRKNLTIITTAQVQRVLIEDGIATGVIYKKKSGKDIKVTATKEVILSAGAVGSPQILMLSGIGPADHLKDLGIEVVANLPGVGQNLNDHPDFVLKYKSLKPISIWPKTKSYKKILSGIQWILTRKGICASNHFDVVGCIRSGPGVEYPDLQLTISPIAVDDKTWSPLQEHAFQIHVGLMRAHSRGEVKLRDSNPMSPPRILVNYLKDSRDRDLLRTGIRLVRELVDQPTFSGIRGAEIFPGDNIQADDALDQHMNTHTTTQWHLSGTARMGSKTDKGAVVDPSGKVYGISGLRVIDASIMPMVTNGNTNSPTIMIAEKLSDSILGNPPLPSIEAEVWRNQDYETKQR